MNIDINIIKLLLNKDIYIKYNKYINLDYYKNNNKEVFKVLLSLYELHSQKEGDVSLNDLAMFFYTQYPLIVNRPDEKVLIDAIFSQVAEADVSEEVAIGYLKKHREQALATEYAIKFLEVSQGKMEMEEAVASIDTSDFDFNVATTDLFVTDDLSILTDLLYSSQGLRWRLLTLNKSLGSLRKGDFGFIFARPETGKTTFLASEVTFMAAQAKKLGLGPVLWLNNEEQGSKVMLRCYQAHFGIETNELYANLEKYKKLFEEDLGGYLKIYDSAKITAQEVEQMCKDLNPSLIIFDQLDKIVWKDGERYDLKMKAIYQWARELAKGYAPFIAVCQAGGTAENKKYLEMNDVDSSHTAKQGEADFMMGIGKTNADAEEFTRFIAISKNKLTGDVDSNADLRHMKAPLRIHPKIARYEDMLKL